MRRKTKIPREDLKLGTAFLSGEPQVFEIKDGRSVIWDVGCCDCSLYHMFIFSRRGDTLVIRAYRDEFMTELGRKKKGKKR